MQKLLMTTKNQTIYNNIQRKPLSFSVRPFIKSTMNQIERLPLKKQKKLLSLTLEAINLLLKKMELLSIKVTLLDLSIKQQSQCPTTTSINSSYRRRFQPKSLILNASMEAVQE